MRSARQIVNQLANSLAWIRLPACIEEMSYSPQNKELRGRSRFAILVVILSDRRMCFLCPSHFAPKLPVCGRNLIQLGRRLKTYCVASTRKEFTCILTSSPNFYCVMGCLCIRAMCPIACSRRHVRSISTIRAIWRGWLKNWIRKACCPLPKTVAAL